MVRPGRVGPRGLLIALELACAKSRGGRCCTCRAGGRTSAAGTLVVAGDRRRGVAIVASRGRRAARPGADVRCFAIGIALQLQLGARLQSDGFYYFAYLRSIAFDHDVNFMNDYRMLGLGDKTYLFQPTRTGYAESAWTIGPAIVWSPFFAVGHVVAAAAARQRAWTSAPTARRIRTGRRSASPACSTACSDAGSPTG